MKVYCRVILNSGKEIFGYITYNSERKFENARNALIKLLEEAKTIYIARSDNDIIVVKTSDISAMEISEHPYPVM